MQEVSSESILAKMREPVWAVLTMEAARSSANDSIKSVSELLKSPDSDWWFNNWSCLSWHNCCSCCCNPCSCCSSCTSWVLVSPRSWWSRWSVSVLRTWSWTRFTAVMVWCTPYCWNCSALARYSLDVSLFSLSWDQYYKHFCLYLIVLWFSHLVWVS